MTSHTCLCNLWCSVKNVLFAELERSTEKLVKMKEVEGYVSPANWSTKPTGVGAPAAAWPKCQCYLLLAELSSKPGCWLCRSELLLKKPWIGNSLSLCFTSQLKHCAVVFRTWLRAQTSRGKAGELHQSFIPFALSLSFLYLEIPGVVLSYWFKKYHFDNLILQKDKVRVFLQESVIAAYIQDLVFNYCYTL